MVICPTDMHMVPAEDVREKGRIISTRFEEQQMQRVPRVDKPRLGDSILYQMGLRSFMRPSICEDFGPHLPLWPSLGDDATSFDLERRITFDRSDHVIIHIPGDTEIPTSLFTFLETLRFQQVNISPTFAESADSSNTRPPDAKHVESTHRGF